MCCLFNVYLTLDSVQDLLYTLYSGVTWQCLGKHK